MIACSDSRVDPAILTSAGPGEIFVVRNVANLVPPYESPVGFHGVSSAIEFAVTNLLVKNIVILGHRQCGGIRVLMTENRPQPNSFIGQWMLIAKAAKEKVLHAHSGDDSETQIKHCELESIKISIANLKTFPFVQEAIEQRGLSIVGAYFDLELGQMLEYDDATDTYRKLGV